ncbi:sorting nexin-15-like isoform X2 [Dendrobates tinctorius]|uniref:sorting nexin-15-like isoform X2 n=1 Tax=Dendrobates tinctorius TaxID=92724 RepID=UPI003CC9A89B
MSRAVRDQYDRRYHVADTRTNPKGFTEYKVIAEFISKKNPQDVKEIVVWKRYSDFKKLHGELSYTHRNLFQRTQEFPPFPRAQVFGRFEAPVIEERRQAAEDMLRFTVNIVALNNSPQLKEFFRTGEVTLRSDGPDSADTVVLPPPLIPEPVRSSSTELKEEVDGSDETETLVLPEVQDTISSSDGALSETESSLNLLSVRCKEEELAPAMPLGEGDGAPYLSQATAEVQQAMDRESSGDYAEAFSLFRNAVDILLKGVKDDHCPDRRESVRRRTAEYLHHAEQIFQDHMGGSIE